MSEQLTSNAAHAHKKKRRKKKTTYHFLRRYIQKCNAAQRKAKV